MDLNFLSEQAKKHTRKTGSNFASFRL
jgi:hypothetical protein